MRQMHAETKLRNWHGDQPGRIRSGCRGRIGRGSVRRRQAVNFVWERAGETTRGSRLVALERCQWSDCNKKVSRPTRCQENAGRDQSGTEAGRLGILIPPTDGF